MNVNNLKVAGGILLIIAPILLGIVLPGILIVVLPSLSIVAGMVLFLDGIGAFGEKAKRNLTQLEMTILRMVSEGSKVESISGSTGVSAIVIQQKIQELHRKGYLSGEKLTEKGYEILQVS